MPFYKNILVAVPPLEPQQRTIDQAVSLARESSAHLTLFSVTEDIEKGYLNFLDTFSETDVLQSMHSKQQAALKQLEAKIKTSYSHVDSAISMGIPFIEIIKQVKQGQYDLLILDAVHRSLGSKRFMGSTTKHVLRKCPCAVLTVRDANLPQKVLAAVDVYQDSEEGILLNEKILAKSSMMAKQFAAELHIVYAQQPLGEPMLSSWGIGEEEVLNNMLLELEQGSKLRLQQLVESNLFGMPVESSVLSGHPRDALAEYIEQQNIDLVVMGTVCRVGIKGFLVGNTAESVLNDVNCSMLALKPEGFVSSVS